MKVVHVSLIAFESLQDGESVASAAVQPWSGRSMNIATGCWHPDAAYRDGAVEARDVVSAAELIAHASPNRLAFVGADALLVPAPETVAETVTGAVFVEALAQAPALTFASGELVMTFVDDRLSDASEVEAPARLPAFVRLADNTVIRLTGIIGTATRRVRDATQLVGLPGASFSFA